MMQRPTYSVRVAALTLCLVLLMAGCGPAVQEPVNPQIPKIPQIPQNTGETDGLQYSLYLNQGKALLMDSNGNELPEEEESYILYDIRTGLAQCMARVRVEDTGVRDQWGYPEVRHLQALYDLEGNLLADWEEVSYRAGAGDFIIRQDYRPFMGEYTDPPEGFKSVLWNYKTRETVWEGVDRVEALEEDALLLVDPDLLLMGIIDLKGNSLAGFPLAENWYGPHAYGEYILACPLNPYRDGNWDRRVDVLLTRDFEELYRFDTAGPEYYGAAGERYLSYQQGGTCGILTAEGDIIYTVRDGSQIAYFDGEILLLWRHNLGSAVYRLERLDGTVIAEGYSYLTSGVPYPYTSPAERFAGIKYGVAQLLDREGKVLAAADVPGAENIDPAGGGYYHCTIKSPIREEWGYTFSPVVLGPNLEEIIPAGTYYAIYRASEWRDNEAVYYDLLFAHKQNAQSITLIDVYDLEGTLLIENLSAIGTVGPNRIAVQKGYSAGMMDWQGNWIAKRSVFTDLADD